ncbi:MAG: 1-deoxy-D-xylulose-5-phosphate reductoisomerase, partial [Clostridia bacterium]|nr:1-deoxy-D-xylulose-5-phosphate reductoisomerase [Clostridia bacterium]
MPKNIAVFGSTGSIGTQALSVAAFHPEDIAVRAIAANRNTALIMEQIEQFRPEYVGMYDEAAAKEIAARFPGVKVVSGNEVNSLAALPEIDTVVNGVSGFYGLFPLLSALDAGKTVALANKESIVCGHRIVDRALAERGGTILPVDSEQSAIFQCLAAGRKEDVNSLILTASGGMFRDFTQEQLSAVTPEMALRHPTWSMG